MNPGPRSGRWSLSADLHDAPGLQRGERAKELRYQWAEIADAVAFRSEHDDGDRQIAQVLL